MSIVYYVTSPNWCIKLRKFCEYLIKWTKRFDTYYPSSASSEPDFAQPRKFR